MRRMILSGVVLAAMATSAVAAPEADVVGQASLAQRFEPFDQAAGEDWAPAYPTPFFRQAATGQPEAVPLTLQPGAYMVVVLCNCGSMDVTLVGPGGSTIAPARSDDHGAMYSLDVPAAGDYLTGIDMNDCDGKCDIAVKVYRRKKA